uniref:VWFC domain-containing protein n=1 Tax=Cyprinodon variegatus TaxID=28743 RepID=A0A3Q2DSU6_CYPVA
PEGNYFSAFNLSPLGAVGCHYEAPAQGPRVAVCGCSTFTPPSDPCSTCYCLRRSCRVQCLHPVPSGTCCPECDSCLYEGVVHSNGHTFTSLSNPCERCTCFRGTVSCGPLNCPLTRCERPVLEPGECCPHCTGTMYKSDEQWEVDECTSCTCVSGDVHCRSQRCPAFSCAPVS